MVQKLQRSLFIISFFFIANNAFAINCTSGIQSDPAVSAAQSTNVVHVMNTTILLGQYTQVTNIQMNETYVFDMIGFDGWISVTTEPNGGTFLAEGPDAVTIVAPSNEDVYVHYLLSSICNVSLENYQTTTVQCLSCPLANDDACSAIFVPSNNTVVMATTTGATLEPNEESITPPLSDVGNCEDFTWCDPLGLNASVWFVFAAPSSGAVKIDLCGSDYYTQLAIYEVGNCSDFSTFNLIGVNENTPIACSGNNFPSETIKACLSPGNLYYILIDENGNSNGGDLEIRISEEATVTNDLTIISTDISPPSCPGGNDGSVILNYAGTHFPFSLVWGNGATGDTITGLSEGQSVSYLLTDFCNHMLSGVITVPNSNIEVISTSPQLSYQGCDANVSLNITGGEEPYAITWSHGATGSSEILLPGSYVVTITDQCSSMGIDTIFVEHILANAGPDQILGCNPIHLGGDAPINPNSYSTITYSLDQNLQEDVACTGNGFISENSRYRMFDLANDFGINTAYHLDEVQVGIFNSVPGSGNLTQTIHMRLHEVDHADLSIANFTLVDEVEIEIPLVTTPTLWSIPIDYTINSNQKIAIEFWNPSGTALSNVLSFGMNGSPTLNNNNTYLSSIPCGIPDPLTLDEIGYSLELVTNLVQYSSNSENYTYVWSPTAGLESPTISHPQLTLYTPGTYTYTLQVIDEFGCTEEDQVEVTVPFSSTEVYVDHTANGLNNGSSWANAFTNLQDALALGDDHLIHIASGTYKPTSGTSRGISFELSSNQVLLGGYPNGGGTRSPSQYPTNLSGEIDNIVGYDGNSYHVIKAQNILCSTLDGIIIRQGSADDSNSFGRARGGGIYIVNSEIDLNNIKFRWNKAVYGACMFATLSSIVHITDCDIKSNIAEYGSALYHSNETSMYINRTRIYNNNATVRCAIEINNSLYTQITNSVIANNASTNANAIALIATNRDQTIDIYNSTILGETKNKNLITMQVGYGDQLDVNLHNSIIAHQNLNFDKAFVSFNNNILNLSVSHCYVQGSSLSGASVAINNLFSDSAGDLLLNSDYSVDPCSPVVNAGNNDNTTLSLDIDGQTRIIGTVDIGAYEAQEECIILKETSNVNESSLEKKVELNVFPNPTAGILIIQSNEQGIISRLYNMLGKEILITKEKELNISNLTKGMYILNIELNNGDISSHKIIKR